MVANKLDGLQPEDDRGMVLPFSPITISFRDIHYFVPLPAVRCVLCVCLDAPRCSSATSDDVSAPMVSSIQHTR